jgi:hypothetical protein
VNIRAPANFVPAGDMGLGLCYLGMRRLAERQLERQQIESGTKQARTDGSLPAGFVPNFAVTLAPYPMHDYATPAGIPVIALPVCFGCLSGSDSQCGGPPADGLASSGLLLIGRGKVPR